MATTTPNFGWPVPTSTDLVKDGATAIEALGDGIDTSLVDLKGGTTGQVLSKTTGADMDFTWVTTDDANAIQNAIVDAKGDIVAASANDTPARLAVGANGETLVADSSTTTGLRYTAGTVQSNPVLNSAMQNWQRGTSFSLAASTNNVYTADRWTVVTNTNQATTVSRQLTNDTTNLPNIQYAMRFQRNSGQTGTGNSFLTQNFETINSIPFAGKTMTYSFYARKGADYSPTSSALGYAISTGTGTDQSLYVGITGQNVVLNASATLTTTWQRFTAAVTIPTTSTEIQLYFTYAPTGTASTNDWFEITGVQLDVGSVALPFRTYAGTIQGELAACQRYYQRFTGESNTALVATGLAYSTTAVNLILPLPVTLRTYPTGTVDYGNLRLTDNVATYTITAITLSADSGNKNLVNIAATGATGLTQYRGYFLAGSGGANYIAFSAEL
jgi:hypothetical protein